VSFLAQSTIKALLKSDPEITDQKGTQKAKLQNAIFIVKQLTLR